MRATYKDWRPSAGSLKILSYIEIILEEFADLGYSLTLRQLYYQLVGKDLIPNRVEEYNKLGNIVSRGRLAGYIDWSMIEDRTRPETTRPSWDDLADFLSTVKKSYHLYRWEYQPFYLEVWAEKDAVSNIIEPICGRYDVTYMANKGYSSQSALYDAFSRLASNYAEHDKRPVILYLGDHDPSGMDMTRDIEDRLNMFLNQEITHPSYLGLQVVRIALNMDQIQAYNLPENPAKITDSRYQGYVAEHGESSWELDALNPEVLVRIVEDHIKQYLTQELFDKVAAQEQTDKDRLNRMIDKLEE